MSKDKYTKTGIKKNIFSARQEIDAGKTANRKAVKPDKSKSKKITVGLHDKQLNYLDKLALDIRNNSGNFLKRSELIRVFINAIEDSNINLTNANDLSEIEEIIKEKLKHA